MLTHTPLELVGTEIFFYYKIFLYHLIKAYNNSCEVELINDSEKKYKKNK